MSLNDQIIETLWHHGITPKYKAYLPLARLLEAVIVWQRLDRPLLEEIAGRYDISLAVLLSRIRSVATALYCKDYEDFCRLNGSWRYNQMDFIAGLAREAAQGLSE